jgi:hypothetical protein
MAKFAHRNSETQKEVDNFGSFDGRYALEALVDLGLVSLAGAQELGPFGSTGVRHQDHDAHRFCFPC